MKTIKQTYKVKAPIGVVWQALTEPKVIEQWGGGPAVMSAKAGSKFKLWGGDIYGKNTQVKAPQLLVQDWNDGNLEKESQVKFELSEKAGVTTITLTHSQIPEERVKDLSDGWKDYYLGPLTELFEK